MIPPTWIDIESKAYVAEAKRRYKHCHVSMGALNTTLHRSQRAVHDFLCPQKLCFANDSIGLKVGDTKPRTSIKSAQGNEIPVL